MKDQSVFYKLPDHQTISKFSKNALQMTSD